MFNGLLDELLKEKIECDTATHAIVKTNDSRISIHDDKIMKFLENEGKGFTLITADLGLGKHCFDRGLNCVPINQKQLVPDHIRKL